MVTGYEEVASCDPAPTLASIAVDLISILAIVGLILF